MASISKIVLNVSSDTYLITTQCKKYENIYISVEPTSDNRNIETITSIGKINYCSDNLSNLVHSVVGDDDDLLERIVVYLNTLSDHEITAITQAYENNVSDVTLVDIVVIGIGAFYTYISQCDIVTDIEINRNMFDYIMLYLNVDIETQKNEMKQLALFVKKFIDFFCPMFVLVDRPNINISGSIAIELINKIAQHTICDIKANFNSDDIERRLNKRLDNEIAKMRIEFDNMMADLRNSLSDVELIANVSHSDPTIQKIIKLGDTSEIQSMIRQDIDNCYNNICQKIRTDFSNKSNSKIKILNVPPKQTKNENLNNLQRNNLQRNNLNSCSWRR